MSSASIKGACLLFGWTLGACASGDAEDQRDSSPDDTQASGSAQFAAHGMPESMRNGGYIDSTFITVSGDRKG